jgi:autotransporter-associated beta strand protein
MIHSTRSSSFSRKNVAYPLPGVVWAILAGAILAAGAPVTHAGDGSWSNTSGGLWSTTAPGNWLSSNIADGTDFTANFNTLNITASPVTVNLDSVRTIGNLIFGDTDTSTAGSWTLANNGTAGNILTLDVTSGAPTITVNTLGAGATATISAVIAGNDGLTKNGAGTLSLTSSSNSYSGLVSVTAGTLSVSSNGALGNASNNLSLDGGTLSFNASSATLGTSRTTTLGAGGGTFAIGGGNFTTDTFATSVTGVGTLTLRGVNSQLNLTGTNDYSGGTVIANGRIQISATALSNAGTTAGAITINGGGLIAAGAFASAQAWLDSGRINTASAGAILLSGSSSASINFSTGGYTSLMLGASANATFSGTLTPSGTTYRLGGGGLGGTLTLSGQNVLTGSNSLVVGNATTDGFGKILLSNSNDYSAGTTVTLGSRLAISNGAALGSGAVEVTNGELALLGGVTVNNTLNLNGSTTGIVNVGNPLVSETGSNVWAGQVNLTAASRIAASDTAGNSLTIGGPLSLGGNGLTIQTGNATGGAIIINGQMSGAGAVSKSGSNLLTLNGDNSGRSGTTTISAGTIAVGHDSALGTNTLTFSGSGGIQSADATAHTLANAFGTFAGTNAVYTFGATSGGTGNLTFSSTASASIGTGARTFQIHSTVEFNNPFTSSGSIAKTGNGTMIMNGASTYSGGTTISAGALLANNVGATSATGTGAISVSIGGTLGGTGRLAPTGTNGLTVSGDGTNGGLVDLSTNNLAEDLVLDLAGTGTATFQSGAKFKFELGAPGTSDVFAFVGMADASVAVFNSNVVDFSNLGGFNQGLYTLFTFDGATQGDNYTGSLVVGTGLGAFTGEFIYNANSIQLNVVPEPGTWTSLLGGLAMLLGFQRRRRGA